MYKRQSKPFSKRRDRGFGRPREGKSSGFFPGFGRVGFAVDRLELLDANGIALHRVGRFHSLGIEDNWVIALMISHEALVALRENETKRTKIPSPFFVFSFTQL